MINSIYFNLTLQWSIYKITGNDIKKFINNLITNDINKITNAQGIETLILDNKGKILFKFWIFRYQDFFLIITSQLLEKDLIEYFDKRIFLEKILFKKLDFPIYYFEGNLEEFLQKKISKNQSSLNILDKLKKKLTCYQLPQCFIFRLDFSNKKEYKKGYFLLDQSNLFTINVNDDFNIKKKPYFDFETLCFEANHYILGKDIPIETNVLKIKINETLFDFEKGCYPGQEIIIRSKSRGQVSAKQLVAISLENNNKEKVDKKTKKSSEILSSKTRSKAIILEKGMELKTEGRTIGVVLQSYFSPTLNKEIALAEIHKDYIIDDLVIPVIINKKIFSIKVTLSPFLGDDNEKKKFEKLFKKGLDAYHQNNIEKAKSYFIDGLKLYPSNPDALEAMGVIEENLGNIEEAIKLNKRFTEVNPEAVMARTNLSRLYMKKGWIEKAEEEKQKATVLMFKETAKKNRLQKKDKLFQEEKINFDDEIEKRNKIFLQVLELDSNDEIANFGLGKILYEKKQYLSSIKHLQKVIEINPQYSLAYTYLAKSMIAENQIKNAREILQQGIQQAKQQGNMVPLKTMEETLRELDSI